MEMLVPRRKAAPVTISAYSGDFERFQKLLELLNSDLDDDGEYSQEDLFAFMFGKALDSLPDYRDRVLGITRKGRKAKKLEAYGQ